jgi:hypothetical protein
MHTTVIQDASQIQKKNYFFPGLPYSEELSQSPRGDPQGFPSMPRNLEKVQKYHQPAKLAIFFRANLFITLL